MSDGISIIIPTFNVPEFLYECIESIYNQKTNVKYEIIIGIDNCNLTISHIQENQDFYKQCKVFYFNENIGPYTIKNNLVGEALYDNILFFDSDDVMYDNLIEVVNETFKKYVVVRFKLQNFKIDNGEEITLGVENSVGVFGIKKQKFTQLNGFENWPCHADSEFKKRSNYYVLWTRELDKILFKRRLHTKNLTVSEKTNMKSEIRQHYQTLSSKKPKGENPEIVKKEYSLVSFD